MRKIQKAYKVAYKYKHSRQAVQNKLVVLNKDDAGNIVLDKKQKIWHKKTYQNAMLNNCKLFCPFSIRIDPYLGCAFECNYCFAKATYERVGIWRPIKPSNIEIIKNNFEKAFSGKSYPEYSLLGLLKNKYPAKVGVMTDPFQPIENQHRITEAVIKLSLQYDYPLVFITKGIPNERHLALMAQKPENFIVVQTITTLDDDIRKKLEPYASSVQQRIDLGWKLDKIGVSVKINAKPTIPLPNMSGDIEFIDKITDLHPANQLALEFLYLSAVTFPLMESIGVNLKDKMAYIADDNFAYIKDELKTEIVREAKKIVNRKGKLFSVCDIEQISSDDPICCNIGNEEKFQIMQKVPIFRYLFKVAKKNGGKITLEEAMKEIEYWKIRKETFIKNWKEGVFARSDMKYNSHDDYYYIEKKKHEVASDGVTKDVTSFFKKSQSSDI